MIWDVSPAGSAEWANLPADAFGEARFVADRRLLASGGGGPWSGLVTLWDIAAVSEPRGIRIFERPGYGDCCASGLRVSSDGATFAALFFDAGISVRDVATREEFLFVPTSPADEDVITPFDLSPDGRYVAIGMDRDRAVRTFQLAGYEVAAYRALRILDRSGREVRAPLREGRGFRVNGFRFAPDGRLIVTASGHGADQRLRIWNWERGVVVTEISGAFDLGYSGPELAFDPSGRLIATVADRLVRIWSVESGAPVATLPRQPAEILAIAFSPDGGSVATAASDGTVRLFDVARETQRLVLQGPIEDARRLTDDEEGYLFARSVAFSPDGSLLASVDGTTVRVWALDIDDLLEIAGRNVTRSLTGEECRQYLHVETCPAA
jgi:WD40 repeat protein